MSEQSEKILPAPWEPPYETIKYEIAITSLPEPAQQEIPLSQTVSAWLVPSIALLAVIVAFGQWSINRKRLKHELFDRRMVVFDALNELMSDCFTEDEIDWRKMVDYTVKTKGARFLFDKETENYIRDIFRKSAQLRTKRKLKLVYSEDANKASELKDCEAEIEELLIWFNKEQECLEDKFALFLAINK